MKRAFVGAMGAGALLALTLVTPASAAEPPILVQSDCLTDWYVNPDEGQLLPDQLEEGLLFDGPSLVHHPIDPPISLADLTSGTFVADLDTGVLPLFKVETLDPYSTLNYVGGGLWWSSKIAAGMGSQSSPQTPAVLAGLMPYKTTTTVYSFGVGYANDAGNVATVSSVSFMSETYDLTCPEPEPTDTTAEVTTTTTTATTTAAATLPVTGPSTTGVAIIGVSLIVAGAAIVIVMRRKRESTDTGQ